MIDEQRTPITSLLIENLPASDIIFRLFSVNNLESNSWFNYLMTKQLVYILLITV